MTYVCVCVCVAVGGGEDASGHFNRPWTQPADGPAPDQEEPGTPHLYLQTARFSR